MIEGLEIILHISTKLNFECMGEVYCERIRKNVWLVNGMIAITKFF